MNKRENVVSRDHVFKFYRQFVPNYNVNSRSRWKISVICLIVGALLLFQACPIRGVGPRSISMQGGATLTQCPYY